MIRRLLRLFMIEDFEKLYSYIDTIVKKISEIDSKLSTATKRCEKISTLTRELSEVKKSNT
jgi:hypothetical protein